MNQEIPYSPTSALGGVLRAEVSLMPDALLFCLTTFRPLRLSSIQQPADGGMQQEGGFVTVTYKMRAKAVPGASLGDPWPYWWFYLPAPLSAGKGEGEEVAYRVGDSQVLRVVRWLPDVTQAWLQTAHQVARRQRQKPPRLTARRETPPTQQSDGASVEDNGGQ